MKNSAILVITSLFVVAGASAQVEDLSSSDAKVREKAAQSLGEKSDRADPKVLCEALGGVVKDPSFDVRYKAIVSMIKIADPNCVRPLMEATKDPSPEIQSIAVDGLVNYYNPGYVKFGWLNSLKSFGGSLKDRFRDPEPVVVEPAVDVPSEVIGAISPLITGGSSMESRANAARAVGVLRGEEAIPQLKEALRSRDTTIIVEAVRALEKIGDVSVGPELTFLLNDSDAKVKLAAVETVGQLRVEEAKQPLIDLVRGSSAKDIRRAALVALAKIPDNEQEKLFLLYLTDKDQRLRAAAAEGLAREGSLGDLKTIQDAFAIEKTESARLSMAFAAVALGDLSYIQYLVDGLDSTMHRGEARPFLVELARDPKVLAELYTPLTTGTKNQKMELAYIIGRSGNPESIPHLERLAKDADPQVAQAAGLAIKNVQARG